MLTKLLYILGNYDIFDFHFTTIRRITKVISHTSSGGKKGIFCGCNISVLPMAFLKRCYVFCFFLNLGETMASIIKIEVLNLKQDVSPLKGYAAIMFKDRHFTHTIPPNNTFQYVDIFILNVY